MQQIIQSEFSDAVAEETDYPKGIVERVVIEKQNKFPPARETVASSMLYETTMKKKIQEETKEVNYYQIHSYLFILSDCLSTLLIL